MRQGRRRMRGRGSSNPATRIMTENPCRASPPAVDPTTDAGPRRMERERVGGNSLGLGRFWLGAQNLRPRFYYVEPVPLGFVSPLAL